VLERDVPEDGAVGAGDVGAIRATTSGQTQSAEVTYALSQTTGSFHTVDR